MFPGFESNVTLSWPGACEFSQGTGVLPHSPKSANKVILFL